MTISELVTYVGHDDGTVRKAMRQLELYGLAAQVIGSQETWCLTDLGYQLPLPIEELCSKGANFASGEIRPLLLPTTIFSPSESVSGISSSSSRKEVEARISPPAEPPAESPIDAEVSAALCALHKVGIMGKKAMTLARLEWVTPEYVTAMHERWQQEGYTNRDTGLLVRYIEDGDPAPAICEECHGVGGHHAECKSFGDLDKLAELVATGEVKTIPKPSPALVQAMMRYNNDQLAIPY